MAEASTLSPARISFSHDLNLSPSFSYDLHHLDSSLPSTLPPSNADDFDFSVTLDDISIPDPSPADELFSHGKILPLSSLKPGNIRKPPDNLPKESDSPVKPSKPPSPSSSPLSSFWSMARSKSLTAVRASPRPICVFPRSKSTGSDQSQSQSQNQSQKHKKSKLRKHRHYYYSGSGERGSNSYGGGVRINPVISVAAHFSRSGSSVGNGDGGNSGSSVNILFSYLLCNCGSSKELDCGDEI